ncbi:lipid intermediate transporter [Marchantia polymorpha subsp. ruderalis]|uniref:Protein ARV n=2 Tax=Marchantia polymorpha TaxID=3197 RepID=A0AAF6AZY9_MARPO|nr:hypothetical protein MARPO_0050s0018 [Marchantia polymorpha]PTQ38545.1 hypothetical protein MARPO_0050s0018 [Marchantia polymorpha]BBN05323.1 hypothetical protein Mp_3g12130 [Marchantia polymorpha subsp. ruderalis]BBN05324.1 hypothetical protein Mp_3g12130 [Marchantia polymorpha subsp. ruderalis]|eukprot:PTQ38544.1 hypothetical protein MARPO_0050s0018 [Marchantia polymorpha]
MGDTFGGGREAKAGNTDNRADWKEDKDLGTDMNGSRVHGGGAESLDSQVSMVCVNCGRSVLSVYIEYSPGNIRLSNCATCGGIVDKYVEYEIMIVIMDVILHKYEAYRHVFFNYPRLNKLNLQALVWKATLISLLLDAWRWANPGDETVKIEWDNLTRFFITAGKVVLQVGCLNCVYLLVIIATVSILSKTKYHDKSKYKDIFLAILFSSHFKFFVFAMMVWEFSFLMGLMVDLLILTSNIVALEVILNANRLQAATAVINGAIGKSLMVALLRRT